MMTLVWRTRSVREDKEWICNVLDRALRLRTRNRAAICLCLDASKRTLGKGMESDGARLGAGKSGVDLILV